jgi:hypothetical protein
MKLVMKTSFYFIKCYRPVLKAILAHTKCIFVDVQTSEKLKMLFVSVAFLCPVTVYYHQRPSCICMSSNSNRKPHFFSFIMQCK